MIECPVCHDGTLEQESKQAIEIVKRLEEYQKELRETEMDTNTYFVADKIQSILKGDTS